jgi:peptide deformylase
MAILPIRTNPDAVLRQKAKKVTSIDDSIQKLVDDMIETMDAASGVGLAAPQVGVSLRVIIIGMPDEEIITLINPEIIKKGGERIITEACLSVPGYQGEIPRSVWVKVKGKDRYGKEVRFRGEGLLGQAFEHEIDHLNGILYIDHVEGKGKLYKIEFSEEEQKGL